LTGPIARPYWRPGVWQRCNPWTELTVLHWSEGGRDLPTFALQ